MNIFFQNKRAKLKRLSKRAAENSNNYPALAAPGRPTNSQLVDRENNSIIPQKSPSSVSNMAHSMNVSYDEKLQYYTVIHTQ